MKKLLSLVLAVVLLSAICAVPTTAVYDEAVENTLVNALGTIDYFSNGYNGVEYRVLEIVQRDLYDSEFYVPVYSEYDSEWVEYYIVPAADFVAALDSKIALTDELLDLAKSTCDYDSETDTYRAYFMGGYGGMMAPREYIGYIDNGTTYDVYYATINYEYLDEVFDEADLPEGMDKWDYFYSIMNEENYTLEYRGVVYENGPDGFYRILESDGTGRKYTVEINGENVRILSYSDYTAEQLPDKFESEPNYDINGDGNFNMFDYVSVKSLCMKNDATEEQQTSADVNGDGKLNMFDYIAIKSAYFAQ
jgi:hypothetical protein